MKVKLQYSIQEIPSTECFILKQLEMLIYVRKQVVSKIHDKYLIFIRNDVPYYMKT